MIIADLLGWWYTRGWNFSFHYFFVHRTQKISAFFSVSELLMTLFSPFRQDSLQLQNAPISIKMQALGQNLISRIFGFIVRSILILAGLVTVSVTAIIGMAAVLIWPLVPVSPLIALLAMAFGVGL